MLALLANIGSMAQGSIIGAPFTLDLSQAGGPAAAQGTIIASGLNFPYELSVASDGSLLFGQTTTTNLYGLSYGWGQLSTGIAYKLPNLGNGSFGSPVALSEGFSGLVTSVKPLSDGVLVVDSGAAGGGDQGGTGNRAINFVSPNGQTIGSISFSYPPGCSWACWEHGNGMSLVVPGANGSNTVYFIVGSQSDDVATTATVTATGMGLNNVSLNADSIYMMTVQSSNPNSAVITSPPQQIAGGLRNPFALTTDSQGDLLIADNGIDGSHVSHELGADAIDEIPAGTIGQSIYDFGFPDSYTDFGTGQRVSGDPGATLPLVALTPAPDSNGIPQNCEGASAMAFLSAGSFPWVGSQGDIIVACSGSSGPVDNENSVVLYDVASGTLVTILDAGNPGVGDLSGLAFAGNNLFVEDIATNGQEESISGLGQGVIYEFDLSGLATSTPEPGTWGLCLAGFVALCLLFRKV